MRTAAIWLLWFGLLFGLWLAFVGETPTVEEVGGLLAAAVGATAADVVRRLGLLSYRVPFALAPRVALQAWRVVEDFVVVLWVLARSVAGERAEGAFRVVDYAGGGHDAAGRGRRAVVGWAGSLAPNTVVVDVDEVESLVLEHKLVPGHGSVEPLS